jgi:hypothetical protein
MSFVALPTTPLRRHIVLDPLTMLHMVAESTVTWGWSSIRVNAGSVKYGRARLRLRGDPACGEGTPRALHALVADIPCQDISANVY